MPTEYIYVFMQFTEKKKSLSYVTFNEAFITAEKVVYFVR